MREYAGADRIEGPLVVAEGYGKAACGELIEVHAADGVRRHILVPIMVYARP